MPPSYTDVFGGQNIFPAELSLLQLEMTDDVQLQWPVEQALPDAEVFADIIEVDADPGLELAMPSAINASNGQSTLINNLGANTVTVTDIGGNTIGSVASGQVWQFYLNDNTTANGVWKTFQFGTGASSATAAALAGAGLKAITTTLNVKILPQDVSVTPHTVVEADRAQALRWTGGVGTFDLPNPATIGADWFVWIKNAGTGTLTLNPTAGTISGSSTVSAGGSLLLVSDGTNWFTMADGSTDAGGFDYVAIAVAGTGTYTLSGTELNRIAYKLTGLLTGARNIVVPDTIQQYWVNNATTGNFALTVKTAAGTGIVVPPNTQMILYCDGINVVRAQTAQTPVAYCRGTNTGITLAVDSAFTDIPFNAEAIDVGSWHDNAVTNERFFVPIGVTAVEVSFKGEFRVTTAGQNWWQLIIFIYKNAGSIAGAEWLVTPPVVPSTPLTLTIPGLIIPVVAGDYIKAAYFVHSDPGGLLTSVLDDIYLSIRAIG